jgi:hypothetical protein
MAGSPYNYRRPWFWLILIPLLSLNLWFDYHHPLGILLDVAIVLFLVSRSDV